MSEYSKVTKYKVNIQKLISYLYAINEQLEVKYYVYNHTKNETLMYKSNYNSICMQKPLNTEGRNWIPK